jgi:hypothetical protein
MSAADYAFDSDLPLSDLPGGTSVLVSGPGSAGLDTLVHQLLDVSNRDDEGMVAISADKDGASYLRNYRSTAGIVDRSLTNVVDCCGDSGLSTDDRIADVSGPSDLTSINMELSACIDDLRFDGVERVRAGLVSVTPLVAACDDMRDIYRFVQNITSRARRTDGLFVCAIDPEADTGDFDSGASITTGLSRAFKHHVELRDGDGGPEVRVDGGSWQSVAL